MNKETDENKPIDPAPLFDLAVAYWRSQVLFTGLDLKIFDAIGDTKASVAELAESCGLPERSLTALLKALAAIDVIESDDGNRFSNSELARTYLCRNRPAYLGDAIQFNARCYDTWGGLSAAIRAGGAIVPTQHFLGDDPTATRNFVLAMHERAKSAAPCLAAMLNLTDCRNLLDIGGGPGTYSMLLADRFPELSITLFDLPPILEVAEELLQDCAGWSRINLHPGDLFEDDFGSGFDAILISGVLHRTEKGSSRDLLEKAATALDDGGILAISDIFTGSSAKGPVLPELFSLQMLLTSREGLAPHLPDISGILEQIGLQVEQTIAFPPPLPHTLCIARK